MSGPDLDHFMAGEMFVCESCAFMSEFEWSDSQNDGEYHFASLLSDVLYRQELEGGHGNSNGIRGLNQ